VDTIFYPQQGETEGRLPAWGLFEIWTGGGGVLETETGIRGGKESLARGGENSGRAKGHSLGENKLTILTEQAATALKFHRDKKRMGDQKRFWGGGGGEGPKDQRKKD